MTEIYGGDGQDFGASTALTDVLNYVDAYDSGEVEPEDSRGVVSCFVKSELRMATNVWEDPSVAELARLSNLREWALAVEVDELTMDIIGQASEKHRRTALLSLGIMATLGGVLPVDEIPLALEVITAAHEDSNPNGIAANTLLTAGIGQAYDHIPDISRVNYAVPDLTERYDVAMEYLTDAALHPTPA
jgi:hypothetical protein